MSEQKNGGPAFPTDEYYDEQRYACTPGMTLRDYFAAHALTALAGNESYVAFVRGWMTGNGPQDKSGPTRATEHMTREAYRIADAMLAQRAAVGGVGSVTVNETRRRGRSSDV